MSFKVSAKSELKERSAALNTQLRFGRERPALLQAYRLRAFLQLRGARDEDEQAELERVEKVIVELERRKSSGIQKLIKSIIETAIISLTPEVDDETTLLDKFRNPLSIASEDLDEDDENFDGESSAIASEEDIDIGEDLEYDDAESLFEPAPDLPEEKPVEADGWGWGVSTDDNADAWSSGRWTSPTAGGARPAETKVRPKETPPPDDRPVATPPDGTKSSAGDDHWGGSEGYSYDDKF